MKQYKIIETFDERLVETTTDDFEVAILAVHAQQDGDVHPADSIALYMLQQGKYVLVGEIEL
jgi:hypothetical protein